MKRSLKQWTRIALMATLISATVYLLPPINLTFLPVPLTLQMMIIVLTGLMLPPVEAMWTVIVYLLLGALGLPVFSGGQAGLSVLLGPRGGFLFAFIPTVIGISLLQTYVKNSFYLGVFIALFLLLFFYPLAVTWLSVMTQTPWWDVFLGLLIYWLLDNLKIVFAILIFQRLKNSHLQ